RTVCEIETDDGEARLVDDEDVVDEHALEAQHKEQVALVYVLEAEDQRAVEADAIGEEGLRELFDRNRKVLPGARQIDEAKVDDLDALIFREPENVLRPGLRDGRCRGRGSLDRQRPLQLPTGSLRGKALASGVRGERPVRS